MGAAARDRADESAVLLRDEMPEERVVVWVARRTVQIVDRGIGFQTASGGSEGHCGAVSQLPM